MFLVHWNEDWEGLLTKAINIGSTQTMMISLYCGYVNKIVFDWMWEYDLSEEIYMNGVSQKDRKKRGNLYTCVDLSALIWSRPPYWDRTRRRVWGRCLGTAELAPGSLSFPAVSSCNTIDLPYIQIYLLVTNLQKWGKSATFFYLRPSFLAI